MSTITWILLSLVGAILLVSCLRLLLGMAALKRRNAELKGYADTYGQRLAEHHDSKLSCSEAITPLRERNRALEARLEDQARAFRGLAEENVTLKASLGAAMEPVDSEASS